MDERTTLLTAALGLTLLWVACGEDTEATSSSTSAPAAQGTSNASTGQGQGGATNGAGGSSSGTGTGGGATACGDMNLVCDAGDICVKMVVTMGPSETVTWECHPDPCAPEPVTCDCAGRICGGSIGAGCDDQPTDSDITCTSGGVCAAPDTPIATPTGERAIADLEVGDLVYSLDGGVLRAVPIVRTQRLPVHAHTVVEVALSSGRKLHISAPHPTADGQRFGELGPGDALGSHRVVSVATVPYEASHTHDILPASDSGSYFAAGALVGTTMRR